MGSTKRRLHARVNMPGAVQGSMDLSTDVQVINLSPGGAMIEHSVHLSPGSPCSLRLHFLGVDLRLKGLIVWSQVKGNRNTAKGEGQLRFRSGLFFPDLPEAAKAQLPRFLDNLRATRAHPAPEAAQPPAAGDSPSPAAPPQGN